MNSKAFTLASASLLLLPVATPNALVSQPASRYSIIHTFKGADGATPYGTLIGDSQGNLYGTTVGGGDSTDALCTNNPFGFGCGVVFRVDQHGDESVLYEFKGGLDGAFPATELLLDRDGNLYGTARGGGILANGSPCAINSGCGVIFKVDPYGKESALYSFKGGTEGWGVSSGVIRDDSGNLYGTTVVGGETNNPVCQGDGPPNGGCGTVFRLNPDGNLTILHRFTGGADGYGPYGDLALDWEGNLLGSASNGGNESSAFCGTTVPNAAFATGCGTIFKIDRNGEFSVVHTFEGTDGGPFPDGWLTTDYLGNVYGVTGNGGSNLSLCGGIGCGTVFKIDRRGKESVLYSFSGGADGASSLGSVIRDRRGNLYGATAFGGETSTPGCTSGGCGVVFKLSPWGQFTVLHTFQGGADGAIPWASLFMAANGELYGTTLTGGDPTCNCGVVFRIALEEDQ